MIKALKKWFIVPLPIWIFLIVFLIGFFWITDLFEALGLSSQNAFYINLVVVITYFIGYFASVLHVYLNSKNK